MKHQLLIEAAVAVSGREYVVVKQGPRSACIARELFMIAERDVKMALARSGVQIIGAKEWRRFVENVARAESSGTSAIIEKVGWNGSAFALPNGDVFAPDANSNFHIAFQAMPSKCSVSGSLKNWKKAVAAELEGQHLAVFILCSMFAAPLLALIDRADNFGFELVGKKGTGKSTLQHIASSAVGGPVRSHAGQYWVTLDTTINALEDTMRDHADLPIVMDEANLLGAGSTQRQRSDIFQALAFKLASGSRKNRFGGQNQANFHCIYMLSSNQTLASLLGQSSESARAAADRLITLPLGGDRPFGVFEFLPAGYNSASEFGEALLSSSARNCGHAMPAFLKCLVKEHAADADALRRALLSQLRQFRRKAGVDPNNGSAVRVANAFGLVWAAGRLCQEYGVLPNNIKVGRAARRCFDMHLSAAADNLTIGDRIRALLANERVVEWREGSSIPQHALALVRRKKSHIELIVPEDRIGIIFPDWAKIRAQGELKKHLIRDGKHLTTKRKLRGRKAERAFCFKICAENSPGQRE